MLVSQLYTARLTYLDREGTASTLTVYYPASGDLDDLIAGIMTDSRYQAISDCTISARMVIATSLIVDGPIPSALNADAGVLIFDGGDTSAICITVPGLKPEYAVTAGCFTGKQVDTSNADIIAFADLIVSSGVIAPDNSVALSLYSGHYATVFYPLDRSSG